MCVWTSSLIEMPCFQKLGLGVGITLHKSMKCPHSCSNIVCVSVCVCVLGVGVTLHKSVVLIKFVMLYVCVLSVKCFVVIFCVSVCVCGRCR